MSIEKKIIQIALGISLIAPALRAGCLEDLQGYLQRHPGHASITLEARGEFHYGEGKLDKKVATGPSIPMDLSIRSTPEGVLLEMGGKSSTLPLVQDPAWSLPNFARNESEWCNPLELEHLAWPAYFLQQTLAVARKSESTNGVWKGRAARKLTISFKPGVPAEDVEFLHGREGRLTVWMGMDGQPLGSELDVHYWGRRGRLSGDFSRTFHESMEFVVEGNQLYPRTLEFSDESQKHWDIAQTTLSLALVRGH